MQTTQFNTTRNGRRPIAEINVVPFIDVMLVLLIIFMITTPLLTQGVKVDLPKAANQKTLTTPIEPIIVSVDSAGNFFLNLAEKPNTPITARTLDYLVSSILRNNQNETRKVLVRGDAHVSYGKIVEAMVILQNAGAKGVGLITEPNSDKHG